MGSNPVQNESAKTFPCRCCGFLTLTDPRSGSYEICPVCFWEDDPVQNEDMSYEGGANPLSLNEARRNHIQMGVADPSNLALTRGPYIEEVPPPPLILGLDSELLDRKQYGVKLALLGTVRGLRVGTIPFLEGCIAITSLGWSVDSEGPLTKCLMFFNAMDSELDCFPVGQARKEWQQDALAKKDAELAEFLGQNRETILNKCNKLEIALLAELSGS